MPRSSNLQTEETMNIVKWLLANSDFSQVGSRAEGGRTILHAAIGAKLPSEMMFISENHGGLLGRSFVAHGSLRTMLEDDDVAKQLINAPDKNGDSPLVMAMNLSSERERSIPQIRGSNGLPITAFIDISLGDFFSDFPEAIDTLLNNKYLRLHGMFGVTKSSVGPRGAFETSAARSSWWAQSKISTLESKASRDLSPFLKKSSRGILALEDFCRHDKHARTVEKMLSGNSGGLGDDKKAQILATYVSEKKRYSWAASTYPSWYFSPTAIQSKLVGTVLRKFFVRHSRPSVDALTESLEELHIASSDLLLLRIRIKLMNKFSIDAKTMRLILQFAGTRDYAEKRLAKLSLVSKVLNDDVAGFFFGGIESCLNRKYGVNHDVWKIVLEFAGYRREMPSIDVLPKVTRSDSNSRKRNRGE